MLKKDLISIVGEKNVSDLETDKIAYSRDCFPLKLMQYKEGNMSPLPDFIVWVENAEQISEILKIANENKIPIIPFGGGGGVNGGIIPITGGIILDVQKMDKIIEINEESLYVTAQAGILGQHLEDALNQRGYTYAHLPSSLQCSTIGGFAANRSAGVLSSKYGKIEDMVIDLEVVLPNGDIIHTNPPKTPRSATGPDLTQFFVGTEGCFGVITEVTLKIHPLPDFRKFIGFLFNDLHSGLEAVKKIFRTGIRPSIVRLYDDVEARMVYKISDIEKGQSYLTLAFDGFNNTRELLENEYKICYEICKKLGGQDMGEEGGKIWFENRLNMYYPNKQYHMAHVLADTIDVATTFDNIENLYYKMKEAIKRRKINVMAHWSHFYPTGGSMYMIFVMIEKNKDHRAEKLYEEAWHDGLEACVANGGTLSHHHGVGIFKGKYMPKQLGSAFELLKLFKKTIDPNNIMNPGKLGFPK
ncbi:MAG: FAD-binding oxidoreductase [Candidatus Helarchaeota archaeon]